MLFCLFGVAKTPGNKPARVGNTSINAAAACGEGGRSDFLDGKKNKQMLDPYHQEVLENADTVASTMECTGLIPTPPVSEGEAEAYTELYSIPTPDKGNPHDLQKLEKKHDLEE